VPAFDLTVIDAQTGHPIKDVIVAIDYNGKNFAFVDSTGYTFDIFCKITDQNGKLRCPSKFFVLNYLLWLRFFDDVGLTVWHPYYYRELQTLELDDIGTTNHVIRLYHMDNTLQLHSNKDPNEYEENCSLYWRIRQIDSEDRRISNSLDSLTYSAFSWVKYRDVFFKNHTELSREEIINAYRKLHEDILSSYTLNDNQRARVGRGFQEIEKLHLLNRNHYSWLNYGIGGL